MNLDYGVDFSRYYTYICIEINYKLKQKLKMENLNFNLDAGQETKELFENVLEDEINSSPGFYEDLEGKKIEVRLSEIYGRRRSGYGSYKSVIDADVDVLDVEEGNYVNKGSFSFSFEKFHNNEDMFESVNDMESTEDLSLEIERVLEIGMSQFLLKILREIEKIETEETEVD